jgi:HAMP domain-containing protein
MGAETKRAKFRVLPLRIELAALGGGLAALFSALSIAAVCYVESRVLETQLLDSGATLAKSIAAESAVPLLARDWVALEVFVADESAHGSFNYLVVTDRGNVVRAATDKAMLGKPFTMPGGAAVSVEDRSVAAKSVRFAGYQDAFVLDTPVQFQNRDIGHLYLGVGKAGMQSVLRSTLVVMSGLGMLTVLGIGGMGLVFGRFIARGIGIASTAMAGLGGGDLERRIAESRSDEIGELFIEFNRMAKSLQAMLAKRAGEPTMLLPPEADADPEATLLIGAELATTAGVRETPESPAPPETVPADLDGLMSESSDPARGQVDHRKSA